MSKFASIVSPGSVTVVVNGKSYTATLGHVNFARIREKVKVQDYGGIVDLFDIGSGIRAATNGKVTITNGTVYYNGQEFHNVLTMRMLEMLEEGFNIDPLCKFLENLMQNPSHVAVNELYLWLEKSKLAITEDGHFLAYKRVNGNYTDCHTGTISNKVGQKPSMPRNQVDDNRDNTCSRGLHFCSEEYLKSFSGERLMLLKINPADVVSIPSDYNNAKGRCWTYEVIAEVADNDVANATDYTKSVWKSHQERRSNGQFGAKVA